MITESLIAKISGVLFGTILSLVFVPPRTLSGLIRRTTVSIIAGGPLGYAIIWKMQWVPDYEGLQTAYCLGAAMSWWAAGAGKRLIERWGK